MRMGKPVSLSEQIAFIRQELCRRDIEYTSKARRGNMLRTVADHKLGCIEAVLNTLLALERRRAE